ncbi:hypothetical protein D8Y20_06410 [Mariprofundus sp. EBB-1]|uniref:hypothetical protein n=1 Tax=Mariprofundus sp. EBB-1 TaxID=2650971 RepID=UPI000EF294F7|nr:hypothetical protein [Mariprofundus sp. EBB-1]RLL52876.1 hypothetical protein D8Y20_06410 [Mariprofundus sp. EBB-1]
MNGLKQIKFMMLLILSLCWAMPAWAVDSYRYLHVSIDTPWAIFVLLFFMVFAPMVLAVVLYWRYALKKDEDDHDA